MEVRIFAGLTQAIGSSKVKLPFTQETTVREIRNVLVNLYPNVKELLDKSMIAVNQEYAFPDTMVTETSEIAVIPPVSGG